VAEDEKIKSLGSTFGALKNLEKADLKL